MNTSFKILWFEDEILWFNMEKLRVESILSTHYLKPKIDRKDGDDFDISQMMGNDYDLILMDFKLAEDVTGDSIVAAIRENDILTDILFYSSEEENMLSAIRNNMPPIDGVYLTKRDHTIFTDKVEKIIGKIVRRSEDVVNLRGFVLDNTSDFELGMKEILNICWQKFNDEQKALLTDTLSQSLEGKKSWVTKQVEKAKKSEVIFSYANNDDYLLSMADRLDVFQRILPILYSMHDLTEDICPAEFKIHYMDNVGVYRNKLGHIALGQKSIFIKGSCVEINQDLHRLLRKNISNMDSLLKKIENYITTQI